MNFRFANENDIHEIIEVIRQSFLKASDEVDEDDANKTAETFAYYYNFDEYLPEYINIAENDDRIVSMAGIIPLSLEKNRAEIKAAQLNPVATLNEYRNKGIAARCIENLCNLLRNDGYSLFYVCGHPNYYSKLGFVPVFNAYRSRISLERLLNITSKAKVIEYSKEYNEQIIEVYKKSVSQNLLKVERNLSWINRKIVDNKDGEYPFCTTLDKNILLSTIDGKITGYLLLNDNNTEVEVEEIKALNTDSILALLKGLERIGEARGVDEIEISDTVPEEIAHRILLDLGGEVKKVNVKAFMLIILSVANLLISMEEEFYQRINSSELAEKPFDLVIKCDDERVRLNYAKELKIVKDKDDETHSKTIKLSKEVLTILFAGYKNIYELIEEGVCHYIDKDEARILNILFPKHNMYISSLDMI